MSAVATPDEIIALLLEVGAVQVRTKPEAWFTWTSGRRAPIYCDNRVLISYPEARGQVADALADAIYGRHPDVQVIAGTATAGIPHAAWVAERLDLPMVYVRGSAKAHGTKKRVEGRELLGERVVVVEDLLSTGGSALASIEALREEGGAVIGLQAIFSYGFAGAGEALAAAGVPARALCDFDRLLEAIDLDATTRQALLGWRAG